MKVKIMKPGFFPAPFWLIPLLSLGAFTLGFGAAYQQDKRRVLEEGELARLHLLYTLEMKDDMGLIDWSKSLEGFGDVRAFQVVVNGKVAAEGGNRNRLPSSLGNGITYFFPAQWGFGWTQGKDAPNPAAFSLVCQTWPGPLLWGLFSLGVCLLPALAVAGLNRKALRGIPTAAMPLPSEPVGSPSPATPEPSYPEEQAVLLFDEKFTILKISERAARLLQKEPSALLQKHLLDLDPDPSLLNAFERAEEVRLAHPFANRPGLLAVLKPGAGGNLLILESSFPAEPLQKR